MGGRHNDQLWYIELFTQLQRTLFDCRRKTGAFDHFINDIDQSIEKMKNCVKEVTLDALDHALNAESIPFNTYVSMVKERNATENYIGRSKEDAVNEDIFSSIYKRMFGLVQSHAFKVDLYPLTVKEDQVEGRRRHHYRKAFPMMVAGFMMMSAFLVPLGFQFMAMIGGKALLLAKLAFMIAVTGGYRRITDHLDYHHDHHHHAHDYLHYLGYLHRSAENTPMTGAYAYNGQYYSPILKKG
ncbi:hypothetical protein O3M35_010896 [Rhynocoris fuscipes]|uniref:Uncharacterized protein n=1 Tax=Rhynocoris fuscipes TaxID=488301 RepID=A0AAW1D7R6_9HEMI